MEQTLFITVLLVSFILFLISIFYTKDYQLQGAFAVISFILFSGLTIQSLNIELITYDGTLAAWKTYQYLDYYLVFGLSFIMSVFSLLNGFIIFTSKSIEVTTNGLNFKRGN